MTGETRKGFQWLRGISGGNEQQPSLLMIGLFTLASLLIIGYRFAVWDQLLYLSCVDRFFLPIVDHPNDIYISNFLWRTYTTFWFLIFPLKQMFGWEWPLFVIYLLVKFFIFWGIWSVSYALTKDRLAAWISLLLLLANKAIVGGGVQLYMQDTITRYVVIPFMLFGMKQLWERKYLAAALLFGFGFQIHAMSAVFWILAAAIGFVIGLVSTGKPMLPAAPLDRQRELRRVGWAVLLFSVLAVPMLIWFGMTQPHPTGDFRNADYVDFVHYRHSYVFLASHDPVAWRTLLISVLLIALAARRLPVDEISRWYVPWTLGIIIVLFIHFLAADVFLYQPIYKLQMSRIVDLLGLLAMIGAARLLALQAQGNWRQRWLAALVSALLLTSVVAAGWTLEFFATAAFFLFLLELEPAPGRFSFPACLILGAFLVIQLLHPPDYGHGSSLKPMTWPALRVALLAIAFILFAGWFNGLAVRRLFVRNSAFAVCLTSLLALVFFERVNITEVRLVRGVDQEADKSYWQRIVSHTREKINWPGDGMQNDWIQFQLWVRDNTPTGTMFFVPPGLNGFRVFSQRNAFLETYDGEPVIFQPAYGAAVIERMKTFQYWPPTVWNADKADRVYHALSADEWQALAQRWDVPYLITSRPLKLPFAKLYERGSLTLWKIVP